jgi:RHS repeat-associated protein
MSRRAQKKVSTYNSGSWSLTSNTSFIYNGWNLVKELRTQNSELQTVSYIWGLDLSGSLQGAGGIGGLLARVKDGVVHQYTYDGNGNVSELVNTDGTIAAHYEYDPYGNTIKADGAIAQDNPFRFSSKYYEVETGLYYYGYRYYSPMLGRWLSKDPYKENGGLNLYQFVFNRPISAVDSLGKNVYVGYRPLEIPVLKEAFPKAGHVYLAFDNKNMEKSSVWKQTLDELHEPMRDDKNYYTFSFHPFYLRNGSTTGSTLGDARQVLVGSGAFVKKNDEAVDILSLQSNKARPYLITTDPCEQARIYKEAYNSYRLNTLEGVYDKGYYSFTINNCGSWAKSILESSGKGWPSYLSVILNDGVGFGGYAEASVGIYYMASVVNQRYESFVELNKNALELAVGTVIITNRTTDSAASGMSDSINTVKWVFINPGY